MPRIPDIGGLKVPRGRGAGGSIPEPSGVAWDASITWDSNVLWS